MTVIATTPQVLQIEFAFHAISMRKGRDRRSRLVLRRTVTAGQSAEHRVEQLYVSNVLSLARTRELVSLLIRRSLARLILARPIDDLHDMASLDPTGNGAAEIDQVKSDLRDSDGTKLVVAFRGQVRTTNQSPELLWADVLGGPGLLSYQARSMLWDSILSIIGRKQAAEAAGGGQSGQISNRICDSADNSGSFDDFARGVDCSENDPTEPHGSLISVPRGDPVRQGGALPLDDVVGVAEALGNAQARLMETMQWCNPLKSRSTVTSLAEGNNANEEPHWLEFTRPAPSVAGSGKVEPNCVLVTFIGVAGGIAGDGGRQTNLFQYQVTPRVDLHMALRDTSVRAAFSEYATYVAGADVNPQVAATLRSEAVDALRQALPDGETDWRADERPTGPKETPISGRVETLDGTIILQDCCGVQVGNHVRQFNTFGCALAPNVKVGNLLREDTELAESIVDYACCTSGPTLRSVQQGLADAVCSSAEAALPRTPGSGLYPVPAIVRNQAGVIAGPGGRQADITEVKADPLNRMNREFRRIHQLVEKAREVELEHQRTEAVKRARIQEETQRLRAVAVDLPSRMNTWRSYIHDEPSRIPDFNDLDGLDRPGRSDGIEMSGP